MFVPFRFLRTNLVGKAATSLRIVAESVLRPLSNHLACTPVPTMLDKSITTR